MGFNATERTSWPDGYKRCTSCLELLPLGDFYGSRKGFLGTMSLCKRCQRLPRTQRPNLATDYRPLDESEWPEGSRRCSICRVVKPLEDFCLNGQSKFGRDQRCRMCRKHDSQRQYREAPYERLILNRVKSRATKGGIPFDLSVEDIHIPEVCPVLGLPLSRGTKRLTDNSPSLDRLVPALGYVRGNVAVISNRANRIKSDATAAELHAVARWTESVCGV